VALIEPPRIVADFAGRDTFAVAHEIDGEGDVAPVMLYT
jgi:hypothetical protein